MFKIYYNTQLAVIKRKKYKCLYIYLFSQEAKIANFTSKPSNDHHHPMLEIVTKMSLLNMNVFS